MTWLQWWIFLKTFLECICSGTSYQFIIVIHCWLLSHTVYVLMISHRIFQWIFYICTYISTCTYIYKQTYICTYINISNETELKSTLKIFEITAILCKVGFQIKIFVCLALAVRVFCVKGKRKPCSSSIVIDLFFYVRSRE